MCSTRLTVFYSLARTHLTEMGEMTKTFAILCPKLQNIKRHYCQLQTGF